MNPHFLRGFAEAVLLAAALLAAWSIKANATEFFPTQQAAKIAAHGKWVAYICTGKDKLWYVGRAKEKTCTHDRPRTTEGERPDDRRSRSVRSDHAVADRSNRASSRGVAETVGLAPPAPPAPPISLSDWQDAADSLLWSFPELQEREREYRQRMLEKGKPILAQAMKEAAAERAARVAEWKRR